MVEVRLLVPIMDNQGNDHPAGEVIDVDVDTAEAWRAAGKVSLVSMETESPDPAGHYTDVTGRDDVPTPQAGGQLPGPQEETKDDDDQPPPKKGKK